MRRVVSVTSGISSQDEVNADKQTLERIHSAFRLYCRSQPAEGRRQLLAIWEELESGGDPFCRCVTAHYLADTQDDLQDELKWDRTALELAESAVGTGGGSNPSVAPLQAFFPSLHLNLADDYRRLGDFDTARRHADRGNELGGALGIDAYGQRIRAELIRVAAQIDDGDSGPSVVFDYD